MKITFKLPFFFTCVFGLLVLMGCTASQNAGSGSGTAAQNQPTHTTVYLVRHAEKAPSSGAMTDDPALSEAGKKRAQVLRETLAAAPVSAIFATKYKRTQETVQPLATLKNVPVQLYEAQDYAAFAQKIKAEQAGKTVVVAGHSNTVLPLMEALGGKKPLAEIADHQYDYLFTVTLREGQEPVVKVQQYGEPSTAPAK
ncbi:histidine phosphatase family protein [Rufibacter glacialis]|uniref:Histidine phosphatase family protein n=1 Tax=Rufibacter glacialis TaxID=1259555 RepID=A0A5M8QT89_9BACT|nr:histidine phosphatase family protein [Rufibacter glacialis]KAA6437693.1 histidine phosphatase family protein [Rufibacter glacialis]GGK57160.1 hypothetical protein GCM10011405_01570 [Rufibacter glacialis]